MVSASACDGVTMKTYSRGSQNLPWMCLCFSRNEGFVVMGCDFGGDGCVARLAHFFCDDDDGEAGPDAE